jgi:hypothetical protein
MTLLSSHGRELERFESLHLKLDCLKGELARAWASPHGSMNVPVLEGRIREMWDQIDGLAISLGEPQIGLAGTVPRTSTARGA